MITLLKLGGSVITDKSKPYTARHEEIRRLTKEVREALDNDPGIKLIIGNGGGSFPHQPAKKGDLANGIKEAWQFEHFVETQRAASELNHLIVEALIREGVPAFAFQPSSAGYTEGGEIKQFNMTAINELLKLGAVPVVHGDIMLDTKQGCSIVSTEKILCYLAKELKVTRVVIGTNVDGVFDSDGKVLKCITKKNFDSAKKHIRGAETTDVTGGMLHKVESMLGLSSLGPEVFIVNALTPGNVKKALSGEWVGTKITSS